MSDNAEDILPHWEAENYVENLQVSALEDVGKIVWFEYHKKLMHLNQQSIFEIANMREETIKEWFVVFQKIPVLVYEAIQVRLWKEKIFPLLVPLIDESTNSFMTYCVFYHEIVVVSLLENILYHRDSIANFDDSALDLIDYAVGYITTIIFSHHVSEPSERSCLEDLRQKKSEIEFDVGIKCISILSYFATALDSLPLSAVKRLLSTHDLPYLLSQLIEKSPWKKKNHNGELFVYESKWKQISMTEEEKICKLEGQVWIALRELLLNPKSAPYYEITEFRMTELTKLQKYLHEQVLDQISPLIDLRRWLSYLSISAQPPAPKPAFSVEITPQIRSAILEKYRKKWKKIASLHAQNLLTKDVQQIQDIAQVLNAAYDLDKLVLDVRKCALCDGIATKRCSKCHTAWYCGRECQVNDWSKHKSECEKKPNRDVESDKNC